MDISTNNTFDSRLAVAQVVDRTGANGLTDSSQPVPGLTYNEVANQLNPLPAATSATAIETAGTNTFTEMVEQVYRTPFLSNSFLVGAAANAEPGRETLRTVTATTSIDPTRAYASGQELNPNANSIQNSTAAMVAYSIQQESEIQAHEEMGQQRSLDTSA